MLNSSVFFRLRRFLGHGKKLIRYCGLTGSLRYMTTAVSHTELDKPVLSNDVEKIKIWNKFSWIGDKIPCFGINGNNVKVLNEPSQFYDTLKERMRKAKKRIIIASLYIGTGRLEEELVQSISEACKKAKEEKNEDFEVHILLDYTRGSRGKTKNSRTLLLPLMKEFDGMVKVHLYHTPDLRGLLKLITPEQYNETIGLNHIKMYLFDDSFIISGGNLSDSYFTNRQDRYILFNQCKEIAEFFTDLVKAVSSFSFVLDINNNAAIDKTSGVHPFRERDRGKRFRMDARQKVLSVLHKYTKQNVKRIKDQKNSQTVELNKSKHMNSNFCQSSKEERLGANDSDHSQSEANSWNININCDKDHNMDHIDTWIYPLIQMGPFNIIDDQLITNQIFSLADKNEKVFLASGYFNLTNDYMHTIVQKSAASYEVLMASPEVNGFFGAKFPLGAIPTSYICIARQFFQEVCQYEHQHRIMLLEYFHDKWTFHVKGLWYYLSDDMLPVMTLIGSSNFGYRSVFRDLECQVAMVTSNTQLRQQLKEEHTRLFDRSVTVTEETFKHKNRHVPVYIRLITPFVKHFF